MPVLNQNFTKFEHDAFVISYTVIDASTALGNSNYCGWWGLGDASTIDSSTSIILQGHSIQTTTSYITTVGTSNGTGCQSTPSGGTLNPSSSPDALVTISDFTVNVSLSYTQFDGITDGDYYHELVLMDKVSNDCYQCRSQVVSSGVLTVNQSLFTEYIYR